MSEISLHENSPFLTRCKEIWTLQRQATATRELADRRHGNTIDCPEEKFKGARGGKVSFDKDSRQLAFTIGPSTWAGKMSADRKAIDISMTEPGHHFLIHFDRLPVKATQPN